MIPLSWLIVAKIDQNPGLPSSSILVLYFATYYDKKGGISLFRENDFILAGFIHSQERSVVGHLNESTLFR